MFPNAARIESLEKEVSSLKTQLNSARSTHTDFSLDKLLSILMNPFDDSITKNDLLIAANLMNKISSEIFLRIAARSQLIAFNIPDKYNLGYIADTILNATGVKLSNIRRLHKKSAKYPCPIMLTFLSKQDANNVLICVPTLRTLLNTKTLFIRKSFSAVERSEQKVRQEHNAKTHLVGVIKSDKDIEPSVDNTKLLKPTGSTFQSPHDRVISHNTHISKSEKSNRLFAKVDLDDSELDDNKYSTNDSHYNASTTNESPLQSMDIIQQAPATPVRKPTPADKQSLQSPVACKTLDVSITDAALNNHQPNNSLMPPIHSASTDNNYLNHLSFSPIDVTLTQTSDLSANTQPCPPSNILPGSQPTIECSKNSRTLSCNKNVKATFDPPYYSISNNRTGLNNPTVPITIPSRHSKTSSPRTTSSCSTSTSNTSLLSTPYTTSLMSFSHYDQNNTARTSYQLQLPPYVSSRQQIIPPNLKFSMNPAPSSCNISSNYAPPANSFNNATSLASHSPGSNSHSVYYPYDTQVHLPKHTTSPTPYTVNKAPSANTNNQSCGVPPFFVQNLNPTIGTPSNIAPLNQQLMPLLMQLITQALVHYQPLTL